jgi:hypothetical protein
MSHSRYWSLEYLCTQNSFDGMIKPRAIVDEIDPQHNNIR